MGNSSRQERKAPKNIIVGKDSLGERRGFRESGSRQESNQPLRHCLKKATLFLQKPVIQILTIAVFGLLAYSNTFHSPFQWDEETFLVGNPFIKDLSYFVDTSKARGLEYYGGLKSRYVGYLSFALNYKAHGFDVMGYHMVNVLVHLLNAFLVYCLVAATFRTPFFIHSRLGENSRKIAFFTSLFFAVHPLQTEAVTYIFQRFASLVTLFYLSSLVLYVYFRLEGEEKVHIRNYRSVIFYILSLMFAILAMKTKENAFTLPIIVVLYELFFFQGSIRKRIRYLIPMLLTLLIVPLTVIGADRPLGEIIGHMKDPGSLGYSGVSREEYLFTQFRVIVTYIRLFFLPVNQNIDYNYPLAHSLFEPGVFTAFLFLSALIGVGAYLFHRSRFIPDLRLLSFGIYWFFITLSVESSVVPIPMIICEYRVYLPALGVFMALISGVFLIVQKFVSTRMKLYIVTLLMCLAVFLTVAAYARNSAWRSTVSLWEDVVQKSPLSARGHNNLGIAYQSKGQFDMAIEQHQAALKLKPDYAEAHYELGMAYSSKGLLDRAIEQFQIALRLKPDYGDAHNNLGMAYFAKGATDEALGEYRTAVRLKPDLAEAHNNLAVTYELKGQIGSAVEQYRAALRLKPDLAEAHFNLGLIYLNNGSKDMARREFELGLRNKPDDYRARQILHSIMSQ